MQAFVRTPAFTVRRDRNVIVNGEIVGCVYGQPRSWYVGTARRAISDALTDSEKRGPFHAKRDAAAALARAAVRAGRA